VDELAAIITFAPPQHDASDDTRLRIAAGRIQIGLCHNRDFLLKHMLMPKSIDHPELHPSRKRVISVSGNVDSHA
jgi:hypothetical protein